MDPRQTRDRGEALTDHETSSRDETASAYARGARLTLSIHNLLARSIALPFASVAAPCSDNLFEYMYVHDGNAYGDMRFYYNVIEYQKRGNPHTDMVVLACAQPSST